MARPTKYGLSYFPLDVDVFEDDKIFDLQERYGTLGESIYLRLLCLVYKNGYYFEFDSMEKLSKMIARSLGTADKVDLTTVSEAIRCCGECGLFSEELMQQNVLTSRSIQLRFSKARERNCVKVTEYSLLEPNDTQKVSPAENTNGVSVTETPVIVTETPVSVAETPVSVTETPTKEKERKEKESKGEESRAEERKEKESKREESRAEESGAHAAPTPPLPLPLPDQTTLHTLYDRYGEDNVSAYIEKNRRWRADHNLPGYSLRDVEKWLAQDGVAKPPTSSIEDEILEELRRQYSE